VTFQLTHKGARWKLICLEDRMYLEQPNSRLQRTRSASQRSPLSRKLLGRRRIP